MWNWMYVNGWICVNLGCICGIWNTHVIYVMVVSKPFYLYTSVYTSGALTVRVEFP